jgi:hypothetical protein
MAGIAAAIIGGAAALGGAAIGAYGSSKAAKAQAKAAQAGINAQERMFERQVELQSPFREAGLSAQNRMLTVLGLPGGDATSADYGSAARGFGDTEFKADPGYAFRLTEGMKALENSAAARGGLLSGAAMKGATRFGQGLASEEYMNAFNRYYKERDALLNPLQAITGAGLTSTGELTRAAGETGRGLAQGYANLGTARGSAYVGATNAAMGAMNSIGGLANNYYSNRMMAPIYERMAGGGGSPSPYSFGAGGYTGYGPYMDRVG